MRSTARRLAILATLSGAALAGTLAASPAWAAEAQWALNNAHAGGTGISFGYGSDGCTPATGDWDGDGDTTSAAVCASGNEWQWSLNNNNAGGSPWRAYGYGSAGCTPVTGDWDGNGTTTVGVACASGGEWQWSLNNGHAGGSPWRVYGYGSAGCTPVTGDWDGNGTTTVGVACASGGEWQFSLNNGHAGGSPWRAYGYGSAGCTPVTGDWDGNGTTTVGVACASGGEWQWSLNNGHAGGSPWRAYGYGSTGRRPVTGDWDGDGDTTVGAVSMGRTVPRGPACPVDGPVRFTDTFGADRSGGRRHQGVDMFAARGTPVVAVVDGTTFNVNNSDTGLGGISMSLRADDGTYYYYAHHDSNVVRADGVRVTKGQVLAYVGNTGNAATTPTHLHFEIHPNGGAAVNPTPSVDAWCPGHG